MLFSHGWIARNWWKKYIADDSWWDVATSRPCVSRRTGNRLELLDLRGTTPSVGSFVAVQSLRSTASINRHRGWQKMAKGSLQIHCASEWFLPKQQPTKANYSGSVQRGKSIIISQINYWPNHQPKSTKLTTNNKVWFSSDNALGTIDIGPVEVLCRDCGGKSSAWSWSIRTVWSFSEGRWSVLSVSGLRHMEREKTVTYRTYMNRSINQSIYLSIYLSIFLSIWLTSYWPLRRGRTILVVWTSVWLAMEDVETGGGSCKSQDSDRW